MPPYSILNKSSLVLIILALPITLPLEAVTP